MNFQSHLIWDFIILEGQLLDILDRYYDIPSHIAIVELPSVVLLIHFRIPRKVKS
jgi:hypothetical protein